MKVITSTTLKGLEGKGKYSLPGEYDLPEDQANDLIARGLAKAKSVVEQEAAAAAGEVSVTVTGVEPKASEPVKAKREQATKGGKSGA